MSPREQDLERMLRRLLGDVDRDEYLRPAEYELVKEARELLGDAPTRQPASQPASHPQDSDLELEGLEEPQEPEDGEGTSYGPDFGPEGIITVPGVAVPDPAPAPVPATPAPRSSSSAPRPGDRTASGGVVLGSVMSPPSPAPDDGPDAIPYAPPPVQPKEEPLEGILLFRFPVTLGMPCTLTVSEQPRQTCQLLRIKSNVPCEGFGTLEDVRIGNYLLLYDGADFTRPDLYAYVKGEPLALGRMGVMRPFDRFIKVRAAYTGLVPEGRAMGEPFVIEVLFEGKVART